MYVCVIILLEICVMTMGISLSAWETSIISYIWYEIINYVNEVKMSILIAYATKSKPSKLLYVQNANQNRVIWYNLTSKAARISFYAFLWLRRVFMLQSRYWYSKEQLMLCAIQKLLSPFPFISNTQEANFIILY